MKVSIAEILGIRVLISKSLIKEKNFEFFNVLKQLQFTLAVYNSNQGALTLLFEDFNFLPMLQNPYEKELN